jgi:hypothetical protein
MFVGVGATTGAFLMVLQIYWPATFSEATSIAALAAVVADVLALGWWTRNLRVGFVVVGLLVGGVATLVGAYLVILLVHGFAGAHPEN